MKKNSNRPYVVCHMLTSLNGKINGDFFKMEENKAISEAYGNIRKEYNCSATLYGTTTMEEVYASGLVNLKERFITRYDRVDYIAKTDVENYIVSIDTEGVLAFESKYIEKKDRPKAHVIQVLSEKVTDDYISYLRSLDISYIFAGIDTLDCTLALQKLKELFQIENLMIAGGGLVNWSFLSKGLIDELSIVISPIAEANNEATIFEKMNHLSKREPILFALKDVKQTEVDGVHLIYLIKN